MPVLVLCSSSSLHSWPLNYMDFGLPWKGFFDTQFTWRKRLFLLGVRLFWCFLGPRL